MKIDYVEPDATQAERREVTRNDADVARTYFEVEWRSAQRSDRPSVEVTGVSAKPWGHGLPPQSYGADPTGVEPPLGQCVDDLPDMEACLVPGAVSVRALRAAAAQADADSATLTNEVGSDVDEDA